MRKLMITLVVGVLLGAGGFALLDKDTNFDLDAGLKNGGLSIDGFPQGQGDGVSALPAYYTGNCRVPYSTEYCQAHPAQFN